MGTKTKKNKPWNRWWMPNIFGQREAQSVRRRVPQTPPETAEVHPMKERATRDTHEASLGQVLGVVNQHFGPTPTVVDCTEACISALCSLLLAEANGCVALVIEGSPSSGKTTALSFLQSEELREAELVSVSDSFTPASFVSHAATRTREQLTRNDLLPRIRHKALIVPDLSPTLSAEADTLAKNMGILTRVLDGQGYESDSGTHGHRGYVGDYRFAFLAATTPLSPTAWKVMGKVGNRTVLLEAGNESPTIEDLVASTRDETSTNQRVEECKEAVSELLIGLWQDTGGYGSVSWHAEADDEPLVKIIARVAHWVVRCRGSLLPEFMTPQIEAPYRLMSALHDLARGHAIASGRGSLTCEDVQLAVRIGLDSMPLGPRQVIRALLRSEDGRLSSSDTEQVLQKSRPTARGVMETLGTLGAVEAGKQGNSLTISLLESEQWLLDEANRWVLDRVPSRSAVVGLDTIPLS